MKKRIIPTILCAWVSVTLLGSLMVRAQSGQREWDDGFGVPGMNSAVAGLTVFDDGTGPALYAGGGFTTAGGVSANYIAKWNGSAWSPLGSGMNSWVWALTV